MLIAPDWRGGEARHCDPKWSRRLIGGRSAAQETSQSVADVRAVINNIAVDSGSDRSFSDADVVEEALEALEANRSLTSHPIRIAVHDGCIELQGQVSSSQQKTAVETAVMSLPGVKSLVSDISICSAVHGSVGLAHGKHVYPY